MSHRSYAILPKNNYGYYYAKAGVQQAQLSVDAAGQTNFNLYLQRWNGYQWVTVASSTTTSSNESINYNGTAGYYRWYVYSVAGNGTATLGYNLPQ